MRSTRHFLVLLSFLTMCHITHSQDIKTDNHVSISFQIITWKNKIDKVFFNSSSESKQEIKGYSHIKSSTYKYEGPETLVFYTGTQVDHNIAGQVKIPKNSSKVLLIFAENTNGTYNILLLPDDSVNFPYGSFKFFNLTKFPIAAMVQDEKFLIEPKKQQLKKVSSKPDSSNLKVKIALGKPEGWEKFYANSWGHNDNRRTLVLIFEDENGKYIVKRFREQAPANR